MSNGVGEHFWLSLRVRRYSLLYGSFTSLLLPGVLPHSETRISLLMCPLALYRMALILRPSSSAQDALSRTFRTDRLYEGVLETIRFSKWRLAMPIRGLDSRTAVVSSDSPSPQGYKIVRRTRYPGRHACDFFHFPFSLVSPPLFFFSDYQCPLRS